MTSIRPAKPKWQQSPEGLTAPTALGTFSVYKGTDTYWHAKLNDATFPILYSNQDQAKLAAEILAHSSGHPTAISLEWVSNDVGGISTKSISNTFHVVASETIQGFFVMCQDDPADIPMSSMEEAQDACAQYLTFVWFALSEVV